MSKKYLISCDLDESLLRSDKTISWRTKRYIRRFIKNGNIFMMNTGRPYQSAMHFYKMLKLKNMPIIGLNGTHVAFIGDNYNLVDYIPFGFNKDLFKDFINEVKDYLVGAHVEDIKESLNQFAANANLPFSLT
jgi:hydroxymethylpyrimidine pyrophosphatase-like HAD family hydrolase